MSTITRVVGVVQTAFMSLMGVGFVALSAITLIPEEASKLNRLGYYSVCSFAPVSTAILFTLSVAFLFVSYSKYMCLNNDTRLSLTQLRTNSDL